MTPEALELLWLDPPGATRIRARRGFRKILDDARAAEGDGAAGPTLADPRITAEDRRDVSLVLARSEVLGGEAVGRALSLSVREDGKFVAPLLVVGGELTFTFGELETLKATVTNAMPFAGGDEPLKAAIDAAKEFLGFAALSPAPAVLESFTTRIRDAFGKSKRAVPSGYLETQSQRALLEQRHYQKRTFAGAPHIRAEIQPPGDQATMLVFLPEPAANALPLAPKFSARLVCCAHLVTDQDEPFSFALQVLALGRLAPIAPRRD
jgi:hypothetical protein